MLVGAELGPIADDEAEIRIFLGPGDATRFQNRNDLEHIVEYSALVRFDDHAAEHRRHRKSCDIAAEFGDLVLALEAAERTQRVFGSCEVLLGRLMEELQLFCVQAGACETEHETGEIRALDFGLGKVGAFGRFAMIDVDAGTGTSGATLALLAVGERDVHQVETRDTGHQIVSTLEARVDHCVDVVDGDRRLRDVSGDDHLRTAVMPEAEVLVFRRHVAVKRQNFRAQTHLAELLAQRFDFALARHEHQDVSSFAHERGDVGFDVGSGTAIRDRKQAAGNFDDRRIAEVARERVGVNRGAHEHHSQLGVLDDRALEEGDHHFHVAVPLVQLVDDDDVKRELLGVSQHVLQCHTVGGEQALRIDGQLTVVARAHADRLADFFVELACHAASHGARRQTARLRDEHAVSGAHERGRDLGALAGAGFRHHDGDGVVGDALANLFEIRDDREVILFHFSVRHDLAPSVTP